MCEGEQLKIKIPETIQTVAPLWTEKLKKRRTFDTLKKGCKIKGVYLNIGHYDCCIVGEALDLKKRFGEWNVNGDVTKYHNGCKICHGFSQIIHYKILGAEKKDLESELEWFADHLKKKHGSIVKRKKRERQ